MYVYVLQAASDNRRGSQKILNQIGVRELHVQLIHYIRVYITRDVI